MEGSESLAEVLERVAIAAARKAEHAIEHGDQNRAQAYANVAKALTEARTSAPRERSGSARFS